MNCPACHESFPEVFGIHCCPVLQNRPDTPEGEPVLMWQCATEEAQA